MIEGAKNLESFKEPETCSCDICKSMCERPCWPTPEEAFALIEAGLGPRLMQDEWVPAPQLLCPALIGHEGGYAPFIPYGKCTFQTADGLCELHNLGLKPFEGRMAHHDHTVNKGLHPSVAETWANEEGRAVLDLWHESKREVE